ncbi:MAG: GYF domain-containing protein [Alphaproteobacteria bacterium]|nr:GYF domain-containing protein [Alphaproteobacteria bacterium]
MSKTLELSKRAPDAAPQGSPQGETPPAPVVAVKWRIRVNDQDYGPYPRARLIDFLKEGRVAAGTLLCCGSDAEFLPAEKHPNLRWDFNAPPRKRRFGEVKLEPGESEVPVCNYFIAAHLLASNESFERVLRDSGKFTRAAGDMWILRSRLTVQQLRNQLSMIMKPREQFVVVNASKDRLAWFNLGAENDIAVRGVWDSDELD